MGDSLSQDFSWDTRQHTKDRPPRRLHTGLPGPTILEPSWLRVLLRILGPPEASSVASPTSGDTGLGEEAATLSAMLKLGRPHSLPFMGTVALPPEVAKRFRLTQPALASPLQEAAPELQPQDGCPCLGTLGPGLQGQQARGRTPSTEAPEGKVGRRCSPQSLPRESCFKPTTLTHNHPRNPDSST